MNMVPGAQPQVVERWSLVAVIVFLKVEGFATAGVSTESRKRGTCLHGPQLWSFHDSVNRG